MSLALLLLSIVVVPLRGQKTEHDTSLLLTRAADVHDLPGNLAAASTVHLFATITYYDPAEQIMFVQDQSGGVSVTSDKPYPVQEGDLVELTGRADASYRTEISTDPTIRFVGKAPSFPASFYSYRELATGRADCRLVRIRGRVRAAGVELHTTVPYLHLDIEMTGGAVEVYVKSFEGFDPVSILDAEVNIIGVQAGSFDAKSQLTGIVLFVQRSSSIQVQSTTPFKVSQLPVTEFDDVFSTLTVHDDSRRIRVRGTVTYRKNGEAAVLERDGKSIYVQTREMSHLEVGDEVDAYGFASASEYAPSLHQAFFAKTGRHQTIEPQSLNYAQAISGEHSDDLVSMTGTLLSELHDSSSRSLVLDFDGHIISAHLDGAISSFNLLPGSRVRVTGICRILAGGPWRTPYLFHLEMRSPADITLLAAPSWWTIRHLAVLLSCLLAFAIIIAFWAVILRIQMSKQSERIKRSMLLESERSRILEKISENLPLPEILSEICASAENLLPGTRCEYDPGTAVNSAENGTVLFEVPLCTLDDHLAGRVILTTGIKDQLRHDHSEVHGLTLQLTTMAVQQSRLHQELVYHSNHDALTDLPNRRLCETRLASSMAEAAREDISLALLYIDVNRFKYVNDRYGHKVGDLYLKEISRRLQRQIRAHDTLARIGGDEFMAITLHDPLLDADFAGTLAQRFSNCFDSPFALDGNIIYGSASIGIARYPMDGSNAEELKRAADQNMYRDKKSGASANNVLREVG